MKKALFISTLITAGIIICSGSKKDTSNTNNNGPTNGTYIASGTISFTAGRVNYSCPISKVIAASTSLTVQTSTADQHTTGSIFVTCYTATSAVTTGTYTSASHTLISSVTFVDKTVTPYLATATKTGSSCTVTITVLTSTSIKGTFTATLLPALSGSNVSITDGVIDCTITSK
ncbi:MAG: hypothetical protein NTV01_19975 [Bacteroidia bacterium]|nr:hypothetical protein [Bacteroidia bacterium]